MQGPEQPIPGSNPDNESSDDKINDSQIESVLNDARADSFNNLVERAVTGGDGESYQEPENVEAHNTERDTMLESYFHYKDKKFKKGRPVGEDFEPAEDLDGLLRQMKIIIDEWHRKPGGDDRDESVRVLELPIIQSLAIREIPPENVARVIELLDDFITVGDDERAKEEAIVLRERIADKKN